MQPEERRGPAFEFLSESEPQPMIQHMIIQYSYLNKYFFYVRNQKPKVLVTKAF